MPRILVGVSANSSSSCSLPASAAGLSLYSTLPVPDTGEIAASGGFSAGGGSFFGVAPSPDMLVEALVQAVIASKMAASQRSG